MKRLILITLLFFGAAFILKAQSVDEDQTNDLLEIYQQYLQEQQYGKAKELLLANKYQFDGEEGGEDAYKLLMSQIGILSYAGNLSMDTLVAYRPYIDFYSHYLLNDMSVCGTSEMWGNLYLFSKIYHDLNDSFIESVYKASVEFYDSILVEDYSSYHEVLNNTIDYFIVNGQYQKALDVAYKDYELLENKNDTTIRRPDNLYLAGRLLLYQLNNKETAKNCLQQAYDLYQNHKSKLHNYESYYILLLDLSSIYFDETNHKASFAYAEELKNALEDDGNLQNEYYVAALTQMCNSADNYIDLVKYAEDAYLASKLLPDNSNVKENAPQKLRLAYAMANTPTDKQLVIMGQNSTSYSNNFGLLFLEANTDFNTGNLDIAKEKFLNLVKHYEADKNDFDDEKYCRSIITLMKIFELEGNTSAADQMFWRASNFYQESGRTCEHIQHMYAMEGLLHFSINDIILARSYMEEALKLFYEAGDNSSIDFIMLLNNLSLVYLELHENLKARLFIDEAKSLIDEIVKKNDKQSLPTQLTILNNICMMYANLGNTSIALETCKEALALCEGDEYNEAKSYALHHLVSILISQDKYNEANGYNQQLLQLQLDKKVKLAALESKLIIKYFTDDKTVVDDLEQHNSSIIDDVATIFGNFTDTEREGYWNEKSDGLTLITNLLADKYPDSKASKIAYNNALFCKGLLLKSTKLLDEIVMSSPNSEIKQKYIQAKTFEELVSSKSTPADSIASYAQQIFLLKKQTLSAIPDFKERLQASFANMEDIQKMLDENDIAVEFIPLNRIVKYGQGDLYYSALVLRKNDILPRMVSLCLVDSMKSLINTSNANEEDQINHIYGLNDNRLYELVWKNLEPELRKGANVYYSPTGLINSINLGAVAHDGIRMGERYKLYQVSSTAEIANVKSIKTQTTQSAVIYGDIDYGETLHEMELYADAYTTRGQSQALPTRSGAATRAWGPLTHTREEAQAVANLFAASHKQSKLLMGGEANEESFKAMDGNAPDVIHVATHGFYIEDRKNTPTDYFSSIKSITVKGQSMLYSGLLFAGANNAWLGDTILPNMEDGILTAQEIGKMDLSNAKIVVLSACQTALGDIDNVNGVFGLQRGFKQAGAGTIVMSLWEVPDAETCELMTAFYRILLSGVEKHEAFRQAQQELRSRKPEPYYWAAFVLLD